MRAWARFFSLDGTLGRKEIHWLDLDDFWAWGDITKGANVCYDLICGYVSVVVDSLSECVVFRYTFTLGSRGGGVGNFMRMWYSWSAHPSRGLWRGVGDS